jgi:SAM-dependent methyltransferase
MNNENRFQDFFNETRYIALKNHLYNYVLRKRCIERLFAREPFDRILEVGSGISPVMTKTNRIIYSELSFLAMKTLRDMQKRGWYVVADATHLPFKDGAVSHVVSSEVLEHIPDDEAVLNEMARVVKVNGRLIATFPHRKFYFAKDDRYVNHYRRYELGEMVQRLQALGLRTVTVQKVLGPLEKIFMMTAVTVFELTLRFRPKKADAQRTPGALLKFAQIPFALLNKLLAVIVHADATVMPQSLASCLLIEAEKTHYYSK